MKLLDCAVERPLRLVKAAEPFLDRALARAWPSYALICALQMKILWNIWRFRDLTTGDTSSYFVSAYRWYKDFAVNFVWSPLYTAFYGTVLTAAGGDVYLATEVHRLIIVMLATLGVLALMRSLLPPALALLIAAWWAIMPINFETLYEVHLFALLPVLAAWLVTTIDDTSWTRGSALAILVATMLLVRNELVVGLIVFAMICLVREIGEARGMKRTELETLWRRRTVAYAAPLAAALGIAAVFYWRSFVKYPEIIAAAHAKHTLNMCQVIAFGYSQRHPEWDLSPWTECRGLAKSLYGSESPTILQMITNNPSAAFEHFFWNLSLTFNGIQVALFNSMSGTINPDYAPVRRSVAAAILSCADLVLLLAAGVEVVRHRDYWWSGWLRQRRGTWLIMLAVFCIALPVIVSQRPRPSYLFSATLVMMASIGMAAHVLTARKWAVAPKILAVIGTPLLLVFVPSYYSTHRSDLPLYTQYERLLPFSGLIADPRNRIIFGDYSGELQGYLHIHLPLYLHLSKAPPVSYDYGILKSWQPHQSLGDFLDRQGINIFFIQPRVMPEIAARPEAHQLLDHPETLGWRKLAPPEAENADWLLLYREPRQAASGAP
jgi:hypothetical protein